MGFVLFRRAGIYRRITGGRQRIDDAKHCYKLLETRSTDSTQLMGAGAQGQKHRILNSKCIHRTAKLHQHSTILIDVLVSQNQGSYVDSTYITNRRVIFIVRRVKHCQNGRDPLSFGGHTSKACPSGTIPQQLQQVSSFREPTRS